MSLINRKSMRIKSQSVKAPKTIAPMKAVSPLRATTSSIKPTKAISPVTSLKKR